ncbi:Gp15 family bacteriophage protein [Enterococcus mundtii]|uniref:Gp15 family bacteriophage protein n=1 Tax=Enterococcus mundtii TaxID=53346 RepID=UPI001CCE1D62|nr:Gp15 family bacteriophage protein [Enterococcus mundtii]UBM06609.1 bacteriophage Gp15 family protein [Enterococcus mundtii]
MRLNDPLVTSIEFEGKEHPIDLTFDNVLDVFDILEDSELFPEEKVNMALGLLLTNFDETSQGSADQQFLLFNYILENYISVGNTDVVETDRLGNPMPSAGKENRNINLVHDAKYIYASFRQIGINLFEEQGRLSWEEFQALLESLPDDTILSRIIQIRNWEPSKGESTREKERMRKLQQKYALPDLEVGEDDG